MPMEKKITPSHQQSSKNKQSGKMPRVSEHTLAFLRAFASNYYVEQRLPHGLQGIMLG